MSRTMALAARIMVPVIVVLGVAGCADKTWTLPTDVEAQAFEELRAEVLQVVSDPGRANKAVRLTVELQETFVAFRNARIRQKSELSTLNADYDATGEQFADLFASIRADNQVVRVRVAEIMAGLSDVTTAGEWRKLAKARSRAMKSTIKSFEAI